MGGSSPRGNTTKAHPTRTNPLPTDLFDSKEAGTRVRHTQFSAGLCLCRASNASSSGSRRATTDVLHVASTLISRSTFLMALLWPRAARVLVAALALALGAAPPAAAQGFGSKMVKSLKKEFDPLLKWVVSKGGSVRGTGGGSTALGGAVPARRPGGGPRPWLPPPGRPVRRSDWVPLLVLASRATWWRFSFCVAAPPAVWHVAQAKVEMGVSDTGVRGLFATQDIPKGGVVWNISATTMINVGASPRSVTVRPACRRVRLAGCLAVAARRC